MCWEFLQFRSFTMSRQDVLGVSIVWGKSLVVCFVMSRRDVLRVPIV